VELEIKDGLKNELFNDKERESEISKEKKQ
jgi:hypothetical protein